jgi:hypothetical protein
MKLDCIVFGRKKPVDQFNPAPSAQAEKATVNNSEKSNPMITTISNAQELFTATYEVTTNILEFDERWNNGTGYFDALTDHSMIKLEDGEIARFHTGVTNNRRGLVVGTPLGNVVVFDRFSNQVGKDTHVTFTFNAPDQLSILKIVPEHTALMRDGMELIIGDPRWPVLSKNVGVRLKELKELFQMTEAMSDIEALTE